MPKNKENSPLPKGDKGRDANGRFKKGEWTGGPGNPYAKQTAALKVALYTAVTKEDINAVVKKMIEQARDGDAAARKEMFDRLWGKAAQSVSLGDMDGGPLEITVNVAAPNNK